MQCKGKAKAYVQVMIYRVCFYFQTFYRGSHLLAGRVDAQAGFWGSRTTGHRAALTSLSTQCSQGVRYYSPRHEPFPHHHSTLPLCFLPVTPLKQPKADGNL